MRRSPIIDTSDVLEFSMAIVIVHDGKVPDPNDFDRNRDVYIVRRRGGYTCHRMMNHVKRQYCWNPAAPTIMEKLADAIERNRPEVYKTIDWGEEFDR